MPYISLIPQKWKILSGSSLKLLAAVTMLFDHIAFVFREPTSTVILSLPGRSLSLYTLMRFAGRLAFPIFCFLLVEGFLHTRDRRKYALRLLVFAFLSEIPWNLEHSGTLFYASQNVFFTLLLGYLGIWAYDMFRTTRWKQILSLTVLFASSVLLDADYGASGYGFILAMYFLRKDALAQAIVGSCFLSTTWKAGLAFIPINLYNGRRGFIRGKAAAYAFYAFYPVHIFILYLIKASLGGY